VLGLREHVQRCQPETVRSAVFVELPLDVRAERDQQVARAGEAVDADRRRQLVLGLLHVQVARADDHVDARDAVGAVGERGDRLRAAHAVHALDAA
jgi:hypothetical protein